MIICKIVWIPFFFNHVNRLRNIYNSLTLYPILNSNPSIIRIQLNYHFEGIKLHDSGVTNIIIIGLNMPNKHNYFPISPTKVKFWRNVNYDLVLVIIFLSSWVVMINYVCAESCYIKEVFICGKGVNVQIPQINFHVYYTAYFKYLPIFIVHYVFQTDND